MIRTERLTANLEGDFVVFLIGMRINRPWRVDAKKQAEPFEFVVGRQGDKRTLNIHDAQHVYVLIEG